MRAVTIRPATLSDTGGILACLRAAFEPFHDAYTEAAYKDTVLTEATLRDRLADMMVLVALDPSGGIIGTLAYRVSSDTEGHLRGMAVSPECQGHGLADQLLDHAEAALMKDGCSRISLDTTEPLERAMRFYERHGYQRSGRTQDFFGMRLIEYLKSLKTDPRVNKALS
jgi:ribosomal protein S18 acetylase RimI-like enzyme